MVTDWLLLVIGLVVLGGSAHFLVHSSVKVARLFGVSELLIGLTLVSLGTSAPELAVSVSAALQGQGAISVGNVIGSNIFNLGFILGLTAVLMSQKIDRRLVYRDGAVLLLATVLILVVVWDFTVTFWESALLLSVLLCYLGYLFVRRDVPLEELQELEGAIALESSLSRKQAWIHFPIFFVSLGVLIWSSELTVDAAVRIATAFGISEWAIGVTIVAAGTSLPELATSIIAGLKRKFDIAIGNVIGSDIFNALGIVGVSGIVAPLTLKSSVSIFGFPDFIFSQILLVLTLLLTLFFFRTFWTLSRREGAILLVLACLRMGFEIWLGMA